MDDISEIINVLKKYFIAYSFVLVDFLFVATFVIKIKKIDKSQTSISLKSIVRVLFKRFELPLTSSPLPTIFLMAPKINVWWK